MKAYIKDKVADYKVPDRIISRDTTMTDSGKIKKTSLEKTLREQMEATLR